VVAGAAAGGGAGGDGDVTAEDVSLRPLTLADMAAAARVHRIAYDERLPWLAGRYTLEQDRWLFRERVFPASEVAGAFIRHRLVGIIAFHAGWVDQLYVLPEMQSRGIGTALLAHAQAKFGHLQLWVFKRNTAARAFYEARGFHFVRAHDGSENDEHEPAALYEWHRDRRAGRHHSA
jgi:ribosomal protein S18 acetylase RimI-like enzyme